MLRKVDVHINKKKKFFYFHGNGGYTDMKGEDINLCIWPDGTTSTVWQLF